MKRYKEFDLGVGLSRKWNAKEAGREVAENTLKKLGHNPSFFVLIATIHYEKHGGFQEFLNGVWEVLPEGTPLVGGTVTGFITSEGCFTRGAAAWAGYYEHMDVAVGFGKNTKRHPFLAGKTCGNKIRSALRHSSYQKKMVFNFIAGGLYLKVPGIGLAKVIKGRLIPKIYDYFFHIFEIFLQKGVGREIEVLSGLKDQLTDYYVIGGSCNDDNNYMSNYQFYNRKVFVNAVVSLGISTDLNGSLHGGHGLDKKGKTLNITKKGWKGYIIKEINGIPATECYLREVGWSKELLNEKINEKTPFFPFGTRDEHGVLYPYPVAIFLGDYLVFSHNIINDEIQLMDTSGKKLIQAIDETIQEMDVTNTLFGFAVSCCARLQTLGKNIYQTQQKMKTFFDDDFLVIYTMGEHRGFPNKNAYQLQESFNLLSINEKKGYKKEKLG